MLADCAQERPGEVRVVDLLAGDFVQDAHELLLAHGRGDEFDLLLSRQIGDQVHTRPRHHQEAD